MVKGERKEFPLPPAPSQEFNFTNGAGMGYEARHVRECLQKGKDVEGSGMEGRAGGGGEGRACLVREEEPSPPLSTQVAD